MLTKPSFGWADIEWNGEILGRISGIDDVPMLFLEALIQYYKSKIALPFGVSFDAEGWEVGFVEIADDLYFFDTKINGDIPNFINLSANTHCMGSECIKRIAKELITDLEADLNDWAAFGVFYYEEKEWRRVVKKNKRALQRKIKKLKRLLNKDRRKVYDISNGACSLSSKRKRWRRVANRILLVLPGYITMHRQ